MKRSSIKKLSVKRRKTKSNYKINKSLKSRKSKRGGGDCTGYTFNLRNPIALDMPEVVPHAPNCQVGGKRKVKRPTSSYMLWFNESRNNIGEKYFSQLEGKERMISIAKKGGKLWKAMSEEEKAPYQKKYLEQKAKYDASKAK